MKAFRSCAVLGLVGAIALACSGSGASIGGADDGGGGGGGDGGGGGNGCPSARPASGAACGTSGLTCTYGCNVKASCDGRTWTVIETAIACPADASTLPDGAIACSKQADCPSTLSCSPGGAPFGCGICMRPEYPCSADTECALLDGAAPPKPMVCGPAGPCACPAGGKTGACIPACQGPNDCGGDETCSAGHCVAKPCTTDAECPSTKSVDYACSPSGTCATKSCKTNADCGAHFCVNGTCYAQPGLCIPPAA